MNKNSLSNQLLGQYWRAIDPWILLALFVRNY